MAVERWPFLFKGDFMRHLLLIFFLIAGCATKPTPYQKESKKEGYRDSLQDELKIATFKANTVTKMEKAQSYAEFRAIENCRENENKHANIIDISDKSVRKDVVRTSGSGWGPSYGFGMYPYYSRYSSIGVGVNYSTMSSDSWNETLVYPIIQVYYTCSDQIVRPELRLKEISSEQMKLLVKDLRGALQIENIPENSPNEKLIEQGDLILKVNGKRIEKIYELIRYFKDKNSVVDLQILREGEKKNVKIKAIDITPEALKAEKKVITNVCKDKKYSHQTTLQKRKICGAKES
jgi:hypothetical protein